MAKLMYTEYKNDKWVICDRGKTKVKNDPVDFGLAVAMFLRMVLGGVFFGILAGLILHLWLLYLDGMPTLDISAIVITVFSLFYLCEQEISDQLGKTAFSAVLAVVCLGFYMAQAGKFAISPSNEHKNPYPNRQRK